MNEQEFKKYVNETMANIFTKLDVNEKKFINHMVNRFNEICEENQELHKNIDKAIDLIEKSVTSDIGINSKGQIVKYHQLTEDETGELLEILKGSDVDE